MRKISWLVHTVFFTLIVLATGGTHAAGKVEIFVAPQGADSNLGNSPAAAVSSLERAKSLASQALQAGARKIQIELAAGVYQGQSVLWDIAAPGAQILVSGPTPGQGDAVFDGETASGNFWVVRLAEPSSQPVETNLTISNITVRNYCEGISFGDYRSKALMRGNQLSNIWFDRIGTKYQSRQVKTRGNCVAAVRLQRAIDTTLQGLRFTNIENLPQSQTEAKRYGPLALHAIYVADMSKGVTISDSVFERFTGSPIRIRNRSDDVSVARSQFREPLYVKNAPDQRPYTLYAISQWNCTTRNAACATKADECPSRNLRLEDITVQGELKLYNDETQRGDPTCKDAERMQNYRSSSQGYKVRVN